MARSYRSIGFVVIALALIAGGCRSLPAILPVEQAERFVQALNADEANMMLASSRAPFALRTQSWETAADGIGFVLSSTEERNCADKDCLRRLFDDLIGSVEIEGTSAAMPVALEDPALEDLLGDDPEIWRDVELFLFLRGTGDVEHIAIVGVDPEQVKVAALYLN